MIHISEEKKKMFVICISGVILFLLDIFFILTPLTNKTADLKARVISTRRSLRDLNQDIAMEAQTQKKLVDLRLEHARYEKQFPKEEELPPLLEDLSKIATASGVDIIAIKPARTQTPPPQEKDSDVFHQVPIEITAKGGYHQLGRFINSLERLDRFMEIKDIEVSCDSTSPLRHNLRLLVCTYILKV